MKTYKFKFSNLFIHWKRNLFLNVCTTLIMIFLMPLLCDAFKNLPIFITIALFLFILFIHLVVDITTELFIDHEKIVFKTLFASKSKTLHFSEISHFCFYDIPVERGGSADQLEAFLKKKPREEHKRKRVRLNFTSYEIDEILSILYRQGFKVFLFEPLKNIEETEQYIEE